MTLSDWDRTRVENLVARQTDIHRLAAQNPSFTGSLLRTELTKTERLVEAFIDMAVTSARYEAYLASVDLTGLDADRARLERDLKFCKDDDPQLQLLKKNLAIILKRQEKMREIRRYLDVARGQLDLIENSFQLIADQIVTMQSPQAALRAARRAAGRRRDDPADGAGSGGPPGNLTDRALRSEK